MIGPDGEVLATTSDAEPFVTVEVVDGRISHFPRAWATVTTDDGRRGIGWLEWNRNVR